MKKSSTKPIAPSRKVLEALAAGLEEIETHFDNEGFGHSPASDDEEDDYDAEDYTSVSYEREDVEVAVDGFISQLIDDKILRKAKSGALPSFGDVFEKLFGKRHDITKMARDFEDHIDGYFGQILYEDMVAAYQIFLEIEEYVKSALAD